MDRNDFCQRWRNREGSFRHKSECFDPNQYDVAPIAGDGVVRAFVQRHHYSGTYPSARRRYGLFEKGGQLVGVAVLSVPARVDVLTLPFPGLVPYRESLELGRLVLLDHVKANAETWFLSRAFEGAARDGIRGIVSFSDPMPRTTADGSRTLPGHIGTIYQAKNAVYAGRATPRTLWLLPDGTVLSDRTKQKIRDLTSGNSDKYRGAVAEVARLESLGARPYDGQDPTLWLNTEVTAICRRLRHPGNHRYLFAIGRKAERRAVSIAMPSLPYPKAA